MFNSEYLHIVLRSYERGGGGGLTVGGMLNILDSNLIKKG